MTSDRSDGVILITGGNSGIGLEAARALARRGEVIAIASRNREASERAAALLARETGNDRIEALSLDLGSLAAVRQFAKELDARAFPLKTLVCNAGLQMNSLVTTPDGFETTFGVNHLGHFLLVNLLVRRLVANAPARIVVVASGVHDPALFTGMPKANVSDWDALAASGGPDADVFDGRLAYVNSKLCNLWFTYELVRRLEAAGIELSVNAYEPGLVPGSGLARDYPPLARWIWDRVGPGFGRLASRFVTSINTAPHSGEALARVVVDPALERTSGKYFPSHSRFLEAKSSDASYDEERARGLWEASVRFAGLSDGESPLA